MKMTNIDLGKKSEAGKFSYWVNTVKIDFKLNKTVYLIFLPILVYYIIFCYIPMSGVIMAFQRFSPGLGIFGSKFIGFKNFTTFFENAFFSRLLLNTFLLSFYGFIFGFPAPIILALLLNEVRSKVYKKVIQTITYIPHFISLTVIVGILRILLQRDGLANYILGFFGVEPINFLVLPEWFRTIFVSSDLWVEVGFGTIIYLAAIASLGTEVYEAALIDGAGRWKQMVYITLPGLLPTIAILMIFSLSGILSVGSNKILLLYNPTTYETADVISTYVYRRGIIMADYSFAAAIGLFNSVISMLLVITVNKISKTISEYSLW